MVGRFNMHKNENELMYEGYIGRGGMATDQQRDNRNLKYGPKYDANNSNLAQFAGLTGNGSMNAAMVASSADLTAQPSDEEDAMIEVKGYGVMRVSQLAGLIHTLTADISKSIDRGVYNIGDKADLLKLFADTYNRLL
tara:strand:- start:2969 stop:3382 length:414 start_codon:yes stop_codon:yes gene_type:complete